ncbi:TPA: hypothetical protein PFE14_004270 [Kluyvera ascorbata]|nr:hypothetical protein [Kluyvera ascorbata]
MDYIVADAIKGLEELLVEKEAASKPVPDEELDQMIWKLERDGMTPKMLSLMRELREVRKANGEPVANMTYKGYLLHAGDPKLANTVSLCLSTPPRQHRQLRMVGRLRQGDWPGYMAAALLCSGMERSLNAPTLPR